MTTNRPAAPPAAAAAPRGAASALGAPAPGRGSRDADAPWNGGAARRARRRRRGAEGALLRRRRRRGARPRAEVGDEHGRRRAQPVPEHGPGRGAQRVDARRRSAPASWRRRSARRGAASGLQLAAGGEARQRLVVAAAPRGSRRTAPGASRASSSAGTAAAAPAARRRAARGATPSRRRRPRRAAGRPPPGAWTRERARACALNTSDGGRAPASMTIPPWPRLLPIAAALQRILDAARAAGGRGGPGRGRRWTACWRRMSIAAHDVPPFANSAMDGFAVAPGPRGAPAAHRGRVARRARRPPPRPATARRCGSRPARRCRAGDRRRAARRARRRRTTAGSRPARRSRPARHVRGAGEDLRAGDDGAAAPARCSGPAQLGVAVGAGARGAALRAPAARGGRRDRRRARRARARRWARARSTTPTRRRSPRWRAREGAEVVVRRGTCPTTPAATRDALAAALRDGRRRRRSPAACRSARTTTSSRALEALGVEERFWRVALRPGKPTWFGTRGRTLVFGLPGNPVSAMVTFLLFARPALARAARAPTAAGRQAGARSAIRSRATPTATSACASRPASDGAVRPTGPQGSHVLSSLAAPTRWRSCRWATASSRPAPRSSWSSSRRRLIARCRSRVPDAMATILLTGATGYVGGRLLPELPRPPATTCAALARNPDKADLPRRRGGRQGRRHRGRAGSTRRSRASTSPTTSIHSMGNGNGGDFAERDRQAAPELRHAPRARRRAARRLPRRPGRAAATHPSTCAAATRSPSILARARPELVYVRAAMVIGAGSASFKMLRHLVQRLPAMITPRWIDTRIAADRDRRRRAARSPRWPSATTRPARSSSAAPTSSPTGR